MSRYGAVVATFTDLMIAAVEESSRRDQREADIEHLFLALITTDYPAGHALRRLECLWRMPARRSRTSMHTSCS